MHAVLTLVVAFTVSAYRLEEQQQKVLNLEPFPLPNSGVKESADALGLLVLSIAMPDAIPKVHKFFNRVGLGEVGKISPGVLRSTLNLEKLKAEGKVDEDYVVTGETKHPVIPELATTYAHGRAIETFLRSDKEYALLFEEDATMVQNGRYLLSKIPGGENGNFVRAIATIISKAPEGWMELNLGRCDAQCHKQHEHARYSEVVTLQSAKYTYCSSGYILSRKGAEYLNETYHGKLSASNDQTKVLAFERGEYKQYGVSPRLIEQEARCGVNGCGNVPECGPISGRKDMEERDCQMNNLCELTAKCLTVDVGSPKIPDDFVFATYPAKKLAALPAARGLLRQKHLRIRAPRMFLSGCGFFTWPLVAIAQLQLASKYDLIGDKKPIFYFPERSHFHECKTADNEERPEFWEKWFETTSNLSTWQNVSEADIWEFNQATTLTSYYDPHSVQGYPYDEDLTGNYSWISEQRAKAFEFVKDFIQPKKKFMDEARKFYLKSFGSFDAPVIGLHMRGTDKFVHKKVDPKRYIVRARLFLNKHPEGKIFLATDDPKYLVMMQDIFGSKVVSVPAMHESENVLYNDKVNKDTKSKQVLMDSIVLSLTSEIVKCWSGVSEFSVYLRQSMTDMKPFTKVVDLEATDEPTFPEGYSKATELATSESVAIGGDKSLFGVFVATLKSRMTHVRDSLNKFNLHKLGHIVPATTPETLDKSKIHNHEMNIKESSCMWSHHKAYKEFLKSDYKYGVIFEDDFISSKNISSEHAEVIRQLVDLREKGKADWDLLNLARCYDCCRSECETVKASITTKSGRKINIIDSPHAYCGTSYLINRKAAESMAAGSDPIVRETDDNMLYLAIKGEYKYQVISPRLFMQDHEKFGSSLHEAPPDLECGACGAGCYSKDLMPVGYEKWIDSSKYTFKGGPDMSTRP